jgi:hypothetical protein
MKAILDRYSPPAQAQRDDVNRVLVIGVIKTALFLVICMLYIMEWTKHNPCDLHDLRMFGWMLLILMLSTWTDALAEAIENKSGTKMPAVEFILNTFLVFLCFVLIWYPKSLIIALALLFAGCYIVMRIRQIAVLVNNHYPNWG